MFCSFIIPTIGRDTLAKAVASVLDQNFTAASYEVIVVNDSGRELQTQHLPHSDCISVINTNRRERSFARNSGAAVAKGEYLWFLDDDDWILPGALDSFWLLANRERQAVWLSGGIQIVDEREGILGEINSGLHGNCFAQIMGGAWAPLQTSIIQTQAFFKLGGFSPFINGTEDEDLCRRAAYMGSFACTPDTVGCLYRGQSWSTSTNYLRAPEDTKYSRDRVLSEPGSFKRLLASAGSGYWLGRVLRIYLSTVSWNLKKKRLFTAVSRMVYSLAAFVLSGHHVFSAGYWQGLKADHVPETLHFVIKKHEQRKKERASRVG